MVGILIDFRVFSVMIIDILHQKVCWDGDLQEGLHFAVVYIEDLLICLVVSSALVKKKLENCAPKPVDTAKNSKNTIAHKPKNAIILYCQNKTSLHNRSPISWNQLKFVYSEKATNI